MSNFLNTLLGIIVGVIAGTLVTIVLAILAPVIILCFAIFTFITMLIVVRGGNIFNITLED